MECQIIHSNSRNIYKVYEEEYLKWVRNIGTETSIKPYEQMGAMINILSEYAIVFQAFCKN